MQLSSKFPVEKVKYRRLKLQFRIWYIDYNHWNIVFSALFIFHDVQTSCKLKWPVINNDRIFISNKLFQTYDILLNYSKIKCVNRKDNFTSQKPTP